MHFKEGDRWKHDRRAYRVKQFLDEGGFGKVWLLESERDGSPVVLKCLHQGDDEDLVRLHRLRELQLSERLYGAASVTEVVPPSSSQSWLGYLQPFAGGVDVDQWLQHSHEFNAFDIVLVCLQIAKTARDAHQLLALAHGDIKLANVRVRFEEETPRTTLVDWDNANARGMPEPKSPGTLDFMAPEALEAYYNGEKHPPDVHSERCSLAKLFHWLLFRRPSVPMTDVRQPDRRAIAGEWDFDPENGRVDVSQHGGLPNDYLNSEIVSLFRRGLSRERDYRPSMDEWISAFLNVVNDGISLCPRCGGPMLIAPRDVCPFCDHHFASLRLDSVSGNHIVVDEATTLVGRHCLNSPRVSRRHAVLSRFGPESFVTDLNSTTGTFRLVEGHWVRLPAQRRCPIVSGDRLRFGDIETSVSESQF